MARGWGAAAGGARSVGEGVEGHVADDAGEDADGGGSDPRSAGGDLDLHRGPDGEQRGGEAEAADHEERPPADAVDGV